MSKKQLSIFAVFLTSISLFSCHKNTQLIASVAAKNNQIKEQNQKVKSKLDKEFDLGNIETITADAFKTSYGAIDETSKEIDDLIANSLKKMSNKQAKKLLDSLNIEMDKQKESLDILQKSLNMDTFYEFPSNVFFDSGKYKISDSKAADLKKILSPTIDSIAKFSNQFPTKRLSLMLTTYGYADGTGFKEGSPLYEFLAKELTKEAPTKEELNQKLSELRANDAVKFVDSYVNEKKGIFQSFDKLNIIDNGLGKGEEFPKKNIEYTQDDERRRIVKFFWKILPKN